MEDGFWLTGFDAGCRFFTIARLTRGARIPDLFSFLMFYESHGVFSEDIDLIGTNFEHLRRTDFHALPASGAFIRIEGNIPVT
jgi:hypothetical protein